MISLVIGVALLLATVGIFRVCMPRNGQVARFVGTEWEPYVAVAISTVAVMSAGFVVLGLMETLGLD